MTYRILITGSRTWDDWQTVWKALDDTIDHAAKTGETEFVVVHGACPRGADQHAADFCEDQAGWRDNASQALGEDRHPADWTARCTPACKPGHRRRRHDGSTYCPAEGVNRNQRMVDLGANICLAFNRGNSTGTADCVRRARRAGIQVREWTA